MQIRIVSAYSKVAYLFAASVLSFVVGGVAWATWGMWAVPLTTVPVQLLVVGFAARSFRDAEVESISDPRPWWQMTAQPTSGYVFGALLLAHSCWFALTAPHSTVDWATVPGVVVEALLGVAFLRSSSRLLAESRAAR